MSLLSEFETMLANAESDIDITIRHLESLMNTSTLRTDESLRLEKALNKAKRVKDALSYLY